MLLQAVNFTRPDKENTVEDQLASCQETEDDVKSLQNDLEEWTIAPHANLEAEKNNLINECKALFQTCPMK